ncbi:DJ-1/PfpI family protein [Streptomyces sp. NBC_01498]|uniref:DJ-1/PfpI family protein n=1 Tax=Streptomyces sp. NBC_01498 TaxID=2975870 RepID=UPI002E7B8487|nr:DJ-1/PfpI family protein [Streptomyces sp. NBC_01498]WTL28025.1 DJ-1/PfpI family protein [Streptomyces sp. NBC_01498]
MSHEATPEPARPLQVAMLLFNGHTALDFIGPHTAFAGAGMNCHLVAETLEPVLTDSGIAIAPTTTFDDCPSQLDVLFVPGGFVEGPMLDNKTIAFLADRGARASYITSVCTGSIVLAAAGLLDGYRAATHWSTRAQLAQLGVEVSTERVCVDRNRFSGGGVTAGIDFGLTLVAHLLGEQAAKFSQLAMEYDPKPPFDAGSPEGAGPEAVALFNQFIAEADKNLTRAASDALGQRMHPHTRPSGPHAEVPAK